VTDLATTAFVAATALHLGFQATVTAVVYPALGRVRAAHWRQAHDRHSRAIAPLVGVAYVALVATGGWLVAVDRQPAALVAVVAAAVPILVTAAVAAPLHRRLNRRDDRLVGQLLRVDRLRLGFAVVALAAALVAAR
jgi:hypothetical protein